MSVKNLPSLIAILLVIAGVLAVAIASK